VPQLRLEEPPLRVEALKTRRYRTAALIVFTFQCALVGSGVVLPIYLQNVLGYTATISGLVMLPGAVIGALCGVLAGNLFDKHGIRGLALFGGAIMAVSGMGLVFYDASTPLIFIILVYTFLVIGLQFLMTPINTWGVNSLDNRVIQHANAVTNTLNQVGASFGTAVIVSLSALGFLIEPTATGRDLVMAGDHISFVTVAVMMVVIFLAIVVAVRDKETDVDPRVIREVQAADLSAGERTWRVRDVMNVQPLRVLDSSTIGEAVSALSKRETSGLVVVDSAGRPVGFMSDGDVMKEIAREETQFRDGVNLAVLIDNRRLQEKVASMLERPVMDVATKKLVTVDVDFALEAACSILAEKRIKKVPVLEEGKLVGTLSRHDVINAMAKVNRLGAEA
jgi:CBS domain-containing protein